jgi:hypothetical protein
MKTTTCAISFAVVVGLVCVPGNIDVGINAPLLSLDTRT